MPKLDESPSACALQPRGIIVGIGRLDIGGVEIRLLRMLSEIAAKNAPISVTIFVTSGRQGTLDDKFRAAGAAIVYGRPGIAGLFHLWLLCLRHRPALVHVNAQFSSGFYCLAALLAGVRYRISHLNTIGSGRPGTPRRVRHFVEQAFLRCFSSRVVGVCDAACEGTFLPAQKWRTIYTGIDLPTAMPSERPPGYDADVFNILLLGRLNMAKNPLRALDILANLKATGTRVRLHQVGPGTAEEIEAFRLRINELGLVGEVVLRGACADPLEHMWPADVLLLPSVREGLPGVVLEALSCGLPVVASDLPGVREIASRTSGIAMLGLGEADGRWAQALLAARSMDRSAIRRRFADSPFTFEEFYVSTLALWAGRSQGKG